MYEMKVGKPLLDSKGNTVALREEGAVVVLDRLSFMLVIAFDRPESSEIKAIREGGLSIGLFAEKDVPFLTFRFQKGENRPIWLDASINMLIEQPEKQDAFLVPIEDIGTTELAVTILLCDKRNSMIEVIRLISIPAPMMNELKRICRAQRSTYTKRDEVTVITQRLTHRYTTQEMHKNASMKHQTARGK